MIKWRHVNLENIDIDMDLPENINIDNQIWKNFNIDKEILQNIDKILNQLEYGQTHFFSLLRIVIVSEEYTTKD